VDRGGSLLRCPGGQPGGAAGFGARDQEVLEQGSCDARGFVGSSARSASARDRRDRQLVATWPAELSGSPGHDQPVATTWVRWR